jgi:hypothetical protein
MSVLWWDLRLVETYLMVIPGWQMAIHRQTPGGKSANLGYLLAL